MLRLIVFRLRAASTPVIVVRVEEQRQRRAERERRVAEHGGVAEQDAVGRAASLASNFSSAAAKISSKPPSWIGMTITATITTM